MEVREKFALFQITKAFESKGLKGEMFLKNSWKVAQQPQ